MAQLVRSQFCYRVVRFYRVSGRRKVIAVGLTRDQAGAHCSRPDTRRAGVWFDGFTLMPGYADYTVNGELPGALDPSPVADPVPVVVRAAVRDGSLGPAALAKYFKLDPVRRGVR